jgi:hypothetical protein
VAGSWQPKNRHFALPEERKERDVRLELGSRVDCTDECFGKLVDVVIDPTSRRVTHVVERDRDRWLGRLVPVELAECGGDAGGAFRRRSRRCFASRRFPRSPTCGSTDSQSTIPTGTSASRRCSRFLTTPRTIGSVARVETDAVRLSLTKDEVGALPPAAVRRWPRPLEHRRPRR